MGVGEMVITQFSGIVNEYLMVYPLGVDVFLSQKAQKGASKSRAVRGVFYVAMIQQIISELARLLLRFACPSGLRWVLLPLALHASLSLNSCCKIIVSMIWFRTVASTSWFDTERCSFLMVYSFVVDGFLSQKARKGASKSRAVRGYFFMWQWFNK